MLSDLSYSALPFDIPILPDHSTPHTEEDPLDFDDLLDIAREFEFTRTITHIWPCEEETSTFPETGLDDILAVIVPTPSTEESPIPLLSSAPSMAPDPAHVQEVGLQRSASVCLANASISTDPVPLPKDDDLAETWAPITSTLLGWSPPTGSQFLDLDDSLMHPQSTKDMWIPPWFAMFPAPSTQPMGDIDQSLVTASAIGNVQPRTSATVPKAPHVSTTDKAVDDPRKKSVPSVPLAVQPSTRAVLGQDRARLPVQTNSNVPSQTVKNPHAKTPKSRPHPPSTSAAGGTSTANHARAPRGGIPPHIARSVTKANILRAEEERKVMQNAFSSTTTGEAKKPSVLRRTAKAERETGNIANDGGSGKKQSGWGEKEGRAAKRARV